MRSRASPRFDSSGKIVHWYGSAEDIHDRKQMEQSLIESEALLKAVFDAVPVGLVTAEAPSGRIVMSNPKTENIFGRPVIAYENMEDYRKAGAFHPNGKPLEPADYPLAQVIATGEPVGPQELSLRRDDGTAVWISATAAPVRNQEGEVIGAVVAILDINEGIREKNGFLEKISGLEKQLEQLKKSSQSC